jgi:4-hydroxy-tetrahydrodipicolinate synthase
MALKGAFTALVTPFTKDNKINIACLEKQVEHQISYGISGLVPCGTTGETPTLSKEEKKQVITAVIELNNNRLPVIAGSGDYNTASTIESTKWVRDAGATAALVVTPYYNKPTQEGLFLHFVEIAKAVPDIDIIIYNVPPRTNVNILPKTVKRIIDEVSNVNVIKDASGNLAQVLEIDRLCGDKMTILSGEDGLIWPYMASGAKGVISVVSNILPKETTELAALGLANKVLAAKNLQNKLTPIINQLFVETNPIPVKYALRKMGFDVGHLRLPLHEPSSENQQLIDKLLKEFNLI